MAIGGRMDRLDLTAHWAGLLSLAIFVGACALIGIVCAGQGLSATVHAQAMQVIEEYGELFLFLLVAITCVNMMEERRIFEVLRVRPVHLGLSDRQLFWLVGALAFFLCWVLDNLMTALIMGAVVMAVGSRVFVAVSCVSLLSIGSAAGMALMGQARGIYTFAAHLKWSWAVGLGYAAAIMAQRRVNAGHS